MSLGFAIRSYLIGLSFFAASAWVLWTSELPRERVLTGMGFALASTFLFPFAKLAWNALRDFFVGETAFAANAVVVLIAKLIVNWVLWGGALFVGPLGLAYLWFRSRGRETGPST